MRILWYNWRDIHHPQAGGAERFTHEILARLAMRGHDVTLFTSEYRNSLQNDNINGIKIIRSGGKYTVYSRARDYFRKHEAHYELIVDSINVRPFLTAKIAKEGRVLPLFYQRAADIWFHELPFPLNYIFYHYLEKKWLSEYIEVPTATISKSSEEDLMSLGFKKTFIIPVGLDVHSLLEVPQKESQPTVIFIGRLRKYKLPDHALKAFNLIKEHLPDSRMWVIGEGSMQKDLEKRFSLRDITFYGHVDDVLKHEMLAKAHILLVPSVREGWGLVVTEANAMGTPTIAYNVPGLRDSVRDGETGVLVKDCTAESMADAAINLFKEKELLNEYSSNALAFSKQFSWDNSVNEFEKIISSGN